ncbi:ubiquitinyl hydrolase 1 [Dictyocaulus viviparus]|uniref:Ubiquitin carboxyl-terminal hydrolase n=1 Tax=Dictyocaulus viviparus TaxID=29172 RepID=A0A0D8XLD8_DICVI|nr:ubiquitinyl hydrolase 1 [Dictyocaulus viviparus]
MTSYGSCVLQHDSLESLNEASELPKEMIMRMFSSIEKMIQEARAARGDIEKQYKLYYRCAQLSKLIYKQSDFTTFKAEHGAIFGLRFKESLDEADNLKAILNKKYEERKLRVSHIPSVDAMQIKDDNAVASKLDMMRKVGPSTSVLISPKELVRMIEQAQPKKNAVIVDFRKDKSELINYKNDHAITVITVPHEVIVHGLIFTSLRNQLEVGQRPLLNRIGLCDIVVLMSDGDVELRNGQPICGSTAQLLSMALYEYNHEHHPKSRPFFMDGGFDNWRDQYPMYIRSNGTLKRNEPKDQLDHMHTGLACLLLDYPDLSPQHCSQQPASTTSQAASAVNRSAIEVPKHEMKPAFVKTEIKAVNDAFRSKRIETTFSANDSEVSSFSNVDDHKVSLECVAASNNSQTVESSSLSQPLSIPQNISGAHQLVSSPSLPTKPLHNGQLFGPDNNKPVASGYHPSVDVVQRSFPARSPMIDRSNKPLQLHETNAVCEYKQVVSNNAIPTKRRLPLLDRSTKPVLISIDQEQQLLDIYNSMCDSTEGSSNRRGMPRPGYTGLYNMGNTCFMNATLQYIIVIPYFIQMTHSSILVFYRHNKMGTGGVISAVFSAMMDLIWSGQYTAIKPQRFLRLFASQVNSCLADGHQHDASEFQLFLLDALHEDTNQVTKRVSFEQNYRGGSQIMSDAKDYERKSRLFACSPINKIFNLQTVSELSCTVCGERSATFEECSLITVELPVHSSRTSLHQCLSSHFSQTTLDGDCRWNCPRCRAPKRASRLTKLWSLPPVVVVHLKRFSMQNGDYAKNTMPVDFDPARLDLSEYLHENSPESAEPYRLYAVTNHSGRLNSGHYTALVCHGTTGEWLRFDDESVSSSSTSGINTSEAYMLYYKRT